MANEDWNQIIEECDQNGDGVIDFQEFVSVCLDRKALTQKNELRKAFSIIDTNQDGKVTLDDFQELFNSYDRYGGQKIDSELWD